MTLARLFSVCILLSILACQNEKTPQTKSLVEDDTTQLSLDEKMQESRKRKEGVINLSSAVRYAASEKKFALWGEMAMQSKYGKPAHNFGYTLLAPPNEILMNLDQGFLHLLSEPENADLLDAWLGHFLIIESVDLVSLEKYTELELANGKKVKFDKETATLGECKLTQKCHATNNGFVIEMENLPFFPSQELAKRYKARMNKRASN
jgi:Fasciclin domain